MDTLPIAKFKTFTKFQIHKYDQSLKPQMKVDQN